MIERDDGFIGVDTTRTTPQASMTWLSGALDRAVGRVLDVGAGAGRASLALQERGQDVVALDVSPGAILACCRRGVRAVYAGSVEQAAAEATIGTFDSALLLGSNLSLLGSPGGCRAIPCRLGRAAAAWRRDRSAPAWIRMQTDKQLHLAYHERNRQRGRIAGHLDDPGPLSAAGHGLVRLARDVRSGAGRDRRSGRLGGRGTAARRRLRGSPDAQIPPGMKCRVVLDGGKPRQDQGTPTSSPRPRWRRRREGRVRSRASTRPC